jgi:aspartyl aminopeptidase
LSGTDTELKTEDRVHMVALFDNEEVGSNSAYGAASTMLSSVMQRIQNSADMDTFHKSIAQSYFLSADMAHAVHPNHSDKHEDNHRPVMNKGVVLKHNANQRYATTAPTAFILHEIAKQNGVPLQEFVIRQDLACGSTIGPIVSTGLGMQTIDVGIPQLAMHSIREMCGSSDIASATKLFKAFFTHFSTTQAKMVVD